MKNENTLLIEYSEQFNKQRRKAPFDIKIAFREALELFITNFKHPSLRNHKLSKEFTGYKSIDVTDDYRAIFIEKQTEGKIFIRFHMLGTHKELYG